MSFDKFRNIVWALLIALGLGSSHLLDGKHDTAAKVEQQATNP